MKKEIIIISFQKMQQKLTGRVEDVLLNQLSEDNKKDLIVKLFESLGDVSKDETMDCLKENHNNGVEISNNHFHYLILDVPQTLCISDDEYIRLLHQYINAELGYSGLFEIVFISDDPFVPFSPQEVVWLGQGLNFIRSEEADEVYNGINEKLKKKGPLGICFRLDEKGVRDENKKLRKDHVPMYSWLFRYFLDAMISAQVNFFGRPDNDNEKEMMQLVYLMIEGKRRELTFEIIVGGQKKRVMYLAPQPEEPKNSN